MDRIVLGKELSEWGEVPRHMARDGVYPGGSWRVVGLVLGVFCGLGEEGKGRI